MMSRSEYLLAAHVAAQQGFELNGDSGRDDTVVVASSLVPGTVSIWSEGDRFLVSVDLPSVTAALQQEFGGKDLAVSAAGEDALYRLLGRTFQLCASLPDHPLRRFEKAISGLPDSTDAERLVRQRIGQQIFREALDGYWETRCAITGICDRHLLRASHIKPWSESTDSERLDVYNGILLVAHLDAAFDKHLMTFSGTGGLILSARRLSPAAVRLLNPTGEPVSVRLAEQHQPYLERHRERFFSLEAGST